MTLYLRLYWEFFKTGLFAIGGGMATLPFLKNIGATTGWFSQTDLMNMLAVSESTPGPVGINMATYVGYTVGGVPGAIVATIGEVTPSIIVILIVAAMLAKFRDILAVAVSGYKALEEELTTAYELAGTKFNHNKIVKIIQFLTNKRMVVQESRGIYRFMPDYHY